VNYSYYGILGDPMVMRELISARIMIDPNLFNEAILEKKPEDYCAWIMDKNSWGGGIELSILPSILNVKIGVVSIRDMAIEYIGEVNYFRANHLIFL
jgi:ubiquitin thioesterase OTU1